MINSQLKDQIFYYKIDVKEVLNDPKNAHIGVNYGFDYEPNFNEAQFAMDINRSKISINGGIINGRDYYIQGDKLDSQKFCDDLKKNNLNDHEIENLKKIHQSDASSVISLIYSNIGVIPNISNLQYNIRDKKLNQYSNYRDVQGDKTLEINVQRDLNNLSNQKIYLKSNFDLKEYSDISSIISVQSRDEIMSSEMLYRDNIKNIIESGNTRSLIGMVSFESNVMKLSENAIDNFSEYVLDNLQDANVNKFLSDKISKSQQEITQNDAEKYLLSIKAEKMLRTYFTKDSKEYVKNYFEILGKVIDKCDDKKERDDVIKHHLDDPFSKLKVYFDDGCFYMSAFDSDSNMIKPNEFMPTSIKKLKLERDIKKDVFQSIKHGIENNMSTEELSSLLIKTVEEKISSNKENNIGINLTDIIGKQDLDSGLKRIATIAINESKEVNREDKKFYEKIFEKISSFFDKVIDLFSSRKQRVEDIGKKIMGSDDLLEELKSVFQNNNMRSADRNIAVRPRANTIHNVKVAY